MALGIDTKADVMKFIEENDIGIIYLWFTDILGVLKSFGITPRQAEEALDEGLGFDGSSVEGFARIYESDLLAMPDLSTFQVLPWQVDGQRAARMICDIHNPDGTPYPGDPRYILRRTCEQAADEGFRMYVGPEMEYFYLAGSEEPEVLDAAGYFDLIPDDLGNTIRHRTIRALEQMGIEVEVGHHEVAPSQHEIDLRYLEALAMADTCMTYRYVVKQIARHNDIYATFMPKPIYGQNGSGMHVHQSLFAGDSNAFFDGGDRWHLSSVGQSYMAGLLHHAREVCAVTNQWVNSYKRLVPGYEAPVYLAWGQRNRSALIRVPMYKPGKETGTRIEFRCPDPACNPYLAFAVMLAAGLNGIRNQMKLPDPVEEDIFHMSDTERRDRRIDTLPESLNHAIDIVESSRLVRETLGEHVFAKFIENKKIEWDGFRTAVTRYELDKYLPLL
jgi:glutamine synthetase